MELINQAEVARRLGVSRQRVSVYARMPGFPAPVRTGTGGRERCGLYDWDAVSDWRDDRYLVSA